MSPIEFHHHRNGSSGTPFAVAASANALHIAWAPNDEDDPVADVSVPWKVVHALASEPAAEDGRRGAAIVGDHFVVAFDWFDDDPAGITMLAVLDPNGDWVETAAFRVGAFPDVRFMHNSYRGDFFHHWMVGWYTKEMLAA